MKLSKLSWFVLYALIITIVLVIGKITRMEIQKITIMGILVTGVFAISPFFKAKFDLSKAKELSTINQADTNMKLRYSTHVVIKLDVSYYISQGITMEKIVQAIHKIKSIVGITYIGENIMTIEYSHLSAFSLVLDIDKKLSYLLPQK